MTGRRITHYINAEGGSLQELQKRSHELQRIQDSLQSFLPSPLNQHCRVANIRQDVIVLNVSSAAWSSRLRFMTPAILNYLRDKCSLGTLKSVRIRVSLPEIMHQGRHEAPLPISQQTAGVLEACAQSLSDPALRETMRRLAKRGKGEI